MTNKKSIWSTIILIASIAAAVVLAVNLIFTFIGLPALREVITKVTEEAGGGDEDVIKAAVDIAIGFVIFMVILGSILDVLKIVGGILFATKGRWGMFCIVFTTISAVVAVIDFITGIRNGASAGTIATDALSLVIGVLLCVACFMHYKENKAA